MEEARASEGVQDELPHLTVPGMAANIKAKSQLDRSLFDLTAGSAAPAGKIFARRLETDVTWTRTQLLA
jgi:hypothetical protein